MMLPTSPYETRQEEYRHDPWKMLIICFMLNQTSHKQVDKIRHTFFEKFPTAKSLVDAQDSEISEIIKPLGFYNKRARAWKEFSRQWIEAVNHNHGDTDIPLHELQEMYGIGKYALDSWKVFQLGAYDIDVEDHVLVWYVEWARKEVERLKREASPYRPYTVYYTHVLDERTGEPNIKYRKDYVCCVNARTQEEAIEKTKNIVLALPNARYVKIMGIGHAKEEWIDETKPLDTNEEYYKSQIKLLYDSKKIIDPDGPSTVKKSIQEQYYFSK